MRVEGGTVGADPAAPAVLEAAHAPSAALAATRKGRLPDQRGGGGARLLERPLAAAAAAAAAAARQRPLSRSRARLARGGDGGGAALAEPLAVRDGGERRLQAVRVHAQVAPVAQQDQLLVLVHDAAGAQHRIR